MKHHHAWLCRAVVLLASMATPLPVAAQQWISLPAPATGADLHGVAFLSRDTGFVCGHRGSGTGILYRTTSRGLSWERITLPGSPRGLNDIRFVAGSPVGAVAGQGGYVALTTDAGVTWLDRSITVATWPRAGDIEAVVFHNDSVGFAAGRASEGNGPRMARTTDGGESWIDIPLDDPPQNNLYDLDFFDEMHGLAVGTGNPPRRSVTSSGGLFWEPRSTISIPGESPESKSLYGVDAVAGTTTAFAAGGKNYGPVAGRYAEVRRTTDRGRTWHATGMSNNPGAFNNPAADVLALSESLLYVSAQNAQLYRSGDSGHTWARIPLPATVSPNRDLRKFSLASDGTIVLVGSGGTVVTASLIPDAAFSLDAVDLGSICAGSTTGASLSIINSGSGLLSVDSIWLENPSSGDVSFRLSPALSFPLMISAGSPRDLEVHADASDAAPAGDYHALLHLRSNDENGSGADTQRRIPITLRIGAPQLSLQPSVSLDAGSLRFAGAQARRMVLNEVLRNIGDCPVTIAHASLAIGTEFSIDSFAPRICRSGEALSLTLQFDPRGPCRRFDTLMIFSDAPDSLYRIPLSGTGVQPSLRLSPHDTLDFGGLLPGERSTDTLHLLNDAPGACLDSTIVSSMLLLGDDSSSFRLDLPVSPPLVIPPGTSRSILITAMPVVAGPAEALLVVSHDAGPPDTLRLRVRGLRPELTVAEDSIVWRNVPIARRLDSLLTGFLRNRGDVDAKIIEMDISGVDASRFRYEAPAPGVRISAGSSVDLAVAFLPLSPGEHGATLRLVFEYETGERIERSIELRGGAESPRIGALQHLVRFDTMTVGDCRDSVLTQFFHNAGLVPLRIDSMRVVDDPAGLPADALSFLVISPANPMVVPPGDSIPLGMRFCAQRTGYHRARLVIWSDTYGDDSLFTIALEGMAVAEPAISIGFGLAPGNNYIDCGRVYVGATEDTSIAIVNHSTIPLKIEQIGTTADREFFLIDPPAPSTLLPGERFGLTLRFAPSLPPGQRYARLVVSFAGGVDSSLLLGGSAVAENLAAAVRGIDAGRLVSGEFSDTSIYLFNRTDSIFADSSLLAASLLDEVLVLSPDGAFTLLSTPTMIPPGGSDSIRIRFTATGAAGERTGSLKIYHNRRGDGVAQQRDSIEIPLRGSVEARTRVIGFALGDDIKGSPGDAIRIPLMVSGDLDDVSLDSLTLLVRFNPRLLKPASVRPLEPGVKAILALDSRRFPDTHYPNNDARVLMLSSESGLPTGTIVDLDFTLLLGDTLHSMITVEAVDGNGFRYQGDSVLITSDFCEAGSRGVTIGAAGILKISPQPARDQVTIELATPSTGTTTLSLYDRLGRELSRALEKQLPPGTTESVIDTSGIPDGLYFVVLRLGRFFFTVPMQVAR